MLVTADRLELSLLLEAVILERGYATDGTKVRDIVRGYVSARMMSSSESSPDPVKAIKEKKKKNPVDIVVEPLLRLRELLWIEYSLWK
ncbi:hypothetical protein HPB50_020707 [Hyalomma asiaticum]|uniref:Uncharacterized protein n=1 Tax=Hyalomma asiaticum TaxID=266040 RepID=A0ACB7S832_HYAAI|nr:hypothetical protein HPB50_020707 [Hyalomma asiaticum]